VSWLISRRLIGFSGSAAITMMMSAMMKKVHQWARSQDQIGQRAQDMRSVLCE